MALEYVQHNREVTPHDIQKWGKLATHDIKVKILLGYELGPIKDKNGTPVTIDKDFINRTVSTTNNYIKQKHKSPFAKLKSFWSKPIEEVEAIPLIKDHDTSNVGGTVGFTQGLLYTEEFEGIFSFFVDGTIVRPEDKKNLQDGLLRNTSFGTRADGSIKEISFVTNEAIAHGGVEMSENDNKKPEKTEKELQFAEELSTLEFEEHKLDNFIIPNHIILSKLIRTGRLEPFRYPEWIDSENTQALQLMERCTSGYDLGLMIGTSRHPEKTEPSAQKVVDTILDSYFKKNPKLKKTKKGEEVKHSPEKDTFINQPFSFEEERKKELKHILELSEYSPEITKKYLQVELGEQVIQDEFDDANLNKYLARSKEIKEKIQNLKIELGEP